MSGAGAEGLQCLPLVEADLPAVLVRCGSLGRLARVRGRCGRLREALSTAIGGEDVDGIVPQMLDQCYRAGGRDGFHCRAMENCSAAGCG